MGVLENVDRWLRPYRYHFEDQEIREHKEQKKRKKKKLKRNTKRIVSLEEQKKTKEFLARGEIGVKLTTLNSILKKEKVLQLLQRSGYNLGYFYHDKDYHQLAIKFKANSSWRYKERNGAKIKKLKPLVYHKDTRTQDRTHMIPIGFHGSEDDARLLVGFSAKINKGELKKFENYIANVNDREEILWFINIVRQKDNTAIWHATVWDKDNNIIDDKKFHDKSQFVWL
ncbi:hypothetical protein MHZ36_12800 [Staphylococcus sp. ACRSN]|uniref:hypothetical protein n=1 Tax=Staphylococcus TaxID=1279 RepID=UPI0011C7D67F|nr:MULTISPECIES: hypothetical protein [Staphylococcus]MCG7340168.1 hypothetical protein [Staphylococcus sp. ACRSN]